MTQHVLPALQPHLPILTLLYNNTMVRLAHFFLIFIALYLGVWWVVLPYALWYAWRNTGYELVLIGIVIDAYFGMFYYVPYYSLASLALVVFMQLLRPRILLYNGKV